MVGVAQLGERCVRNAEVGSSILLLSTNIFISVDSQWLILILFLMQLNFLSFQRNEDLGAMRRLVLFAVLLGAVGSAWAHSELRRSVPAASAVLEQPPDRIELYFNERVQLTALRLHRVGGDEIALPRRSIRPASSETIALPALASGEYRVEWRIISADGHPAGGAIPFRIEPARRP